VKTRQPLRRALVSRRAWDLLGEELRAQVCDELNVTELEPLGAAGEHLVDYSVKANYRALGRRFGKDTPAIAAALADADAAELATELRRCGTASVVAAGTPVQLSGDEVLVTERPRAGWSVANDQGETVALDLARTPDLLRAGLAREVIRAVQGARRSSGLEVSDRISLWWQADGDVAQAVREHHELIAAEVLAVQVSEGAPDAANDAERVELDLGLSVWLQRRLP